MLQRCTTKRITVDTGEENTPGWVFAEDDGKTRHPFWCPLLACRLPIFSSKTQDQKVSSYSWEEGVWYSAGFAVERRAEARGSRRWLDPTGIGTPSNNCHSRKCDWGFCVSQAMISSLCHLIHCQSLLRLLAAELDKADWWDYGSCLIKEMESFTHMRRTAVLAHLRDHYITIAMTDTWLYFKTAELRSSILWLVWWYEVLVSSTHFPRHISVTQREKICTVT